jgi:hypothetical protein
MSLWQSAQSVIASAESNFEYTSTIERIDATFLRMKGMGGIWT